jgi:hypothetical protein
VSRRTQFSCPFFANDFAGEVTAAFNGRGRKGEHQMKLTLRNIAFFATALCTIGTTSAQERRLPSDLAAEVDRTQSKATGRRQPQSRQPAVNDEAPEAMEARPSTQQTRFVAVFVIEGNYYAADQMGFLYFMTGSDIYPAASGRIVGQSRGYFIATDAYGQYYYAVRVR